MGSVVEANLNQLIDVLAMFQKVINYSIANKVT